MANPIRKLHESIENLKSEEKSPHKKLKILHESHSSGLITKEEFERQKTDVEKEITEFESKKPQEESEDNEPKKSDKMLILGILLILAILVCIILYFKFSKNEPKTIEEMHVLNLKGKLDPDLGYIYRGAYSFVTLDNQWYTQLVSQKGTKEYSLSLRYSPKDLENISIHGQLNTDFFNNHSQYYFTFNPSVSDLQYTVLAAADLHTHMIKVFEKEPIAACDRNTTLPCASRPIITCNDSDKLVFYVKNASDLRTSYNGNCIVVEGFGLDLVKGVDRVLYDLYGIME